jgi:hypothetical protein
MVDVVFELDEEPESLEQLFDELLSCLRKICFGQIFLTKVWMRGLHHEN